MANPKSNCTSRTRRHHPRTRRREGAEVGRQLPRLRRSGHYDNTIFHRVIDGFMIQGGGFEPGMKQKPTRQADRERSQQRPQERQVHRRHGAHQDPHSATAQFFINVADNEFLNHTAPTAQGWGYAVFGKVVEGTDVVDKIRGVKTGRKGFHDDVPVTDVVIEKAVALTPPRRRRCTGGQS
jgi:peptidyl-prolyl cis-trans isomerase B (cyclophilin B)